MSADGLTRQTKRKCLSLMTDFCTLSDGSLVEVVPSQENAKNKLSFLIWKAGKISVLDRFECDGTVYVPPTLDDELSRQLDLRLPFNVKPCPSPEDLHAEISNLIRSYVDLPETSACLVAAFAISTWFVDRLDVAPYLWICGPPR
jgi:hypothetical protein